MREQLQDKALIENPGSNKKELERQYAAISELEVEKEAVKQEILIYQDETHIPRVVTEILENWESQSQNLEFNAILTVAYKKRVIAYYKEFKKQMVERGESLNIAMTFSFGNENDPENPAPKEAAMMFEDYSQFTGIEFRAGDKKRGEDAYFEDVVERATRGGSGRNPKNIDLVIVADQLLTGYDSKHLNTLYVDRPLMLQGLIQAYSRTNRVFGETKEFGTIINFQYPRITEEIVNDALKLYGSGGKSSQVIVDHYDVAVKKLYLLLGDLTLILPIPSDWASIKDDEDKKETSKIAFFAASDQVNLVQQYYEYQWHDKNFGMLEHTWLQYIGAYKNLFPSSEGSGAEPSVIRQLQGKTKLANTQVIDAAHILSLIGARVSATDGIQTVDTETKRIIYEQIQELSNMGEAVTAELLREFVEAELLTGYLSSSVNFDEAFDNWKQEKYQVEIGKFADDWGIQDIDTLIKSVKSYSDSQPETIPYIEDINNSVNHDIALNRANKGRLKHIIELGKVLPKWMQEIKSRLS